MKFGTNENGVVMQPNILHLTADISISTAQSPEGAWVYGADVSCSTHGFGHPVMFTDCKKYDSEQAAIASAKETILKYLKRNNEIKIYNKLKKQSEQMSLFDV